MAHNPKLNVYTLKLNPKNDSFEIFRDLFKSKYALKSTISDKDIFLAYHQNFVNGIGDKEFRKDTKNKKVLGTIQQNTDKSILPILSKNNIYIDGVIEGGKYGIRREYADTENKEDKKIIGENNAVLDKYYILLYTPLNSQFGFLLVQSYTEESIQDSLKDFIKNFFSCEDDFYNIIIEPYVPRKIIDKYMKESSIRMFSFTNKVGLSDTLRNNVQIKGQTFEVEIKLKPLDYTLNPDEDSTVEILKEFGEKYFDDIQLKECKRKAYISDKKNRKANYDIEQDIKKIRPTIYLEDAGIIPDDITGLPDFKKIQEYCLDILNDLIIEFNKPSDIYEN